MPTRYHLCGYQIDEDYQSSYTIYRDVATAHELGRDKRYKSDRITCPGCGARFEPQTELIDGPPVPINAADVELTPGRLYTIRGRAIRIYVDRQERLHIGSPPGAARYILEDNSSQVIIT